MLLCITGCNGTPEVAADENVELILYEDLLFPVVWMDSDEGMYQPKYPNKTKLAIESLSTEGAYLSNDSFELIYNSDENFNVAYTYYTPEGTLIETKEALPIEIGIENGKTITIEKPNNRELKPNDVYILEVVLQKGGTKGYMYYPLIYSTTQANVAIIKDVYTLFLQYMKSNTENLMGEPRFSIKAASEEECFILVEFTSAFRLEEGFEYYDKKLLFRKNTDSYELIEASSVDKQRYRYVENVEGWDLGHFSVNQSNVETRRVLESNNKKFQVIYNHNELVIYDVEKEELNEVYRIDSFDSDYIVDEYMNQSIHIFEITDEGEIYFSVDGYINDASKFKQMTGICFYYYDNATLSATGFIEKGETIAKLEAFTNNTIYFNAKDGMYYIYDGALLWSLDGKNGDITYIEAYFNATIDTKNGLLYWQTDASKYNGAINFIHLSKKNLAITNIYTSGMYKHLLGVDKNTLIVGGFDLDTTYEKLNGETITPYNQILMYNFSGQLISTIDRTSLNSNQYYSPLYFDETTQQWLCDIIEMQYDRKENYKNSRIRFVDTGNTLQVLQRVNEEVPEILVTDVIQDNILKVSKSKNVDMQFITKLKTMKSVGNHINLDTMPQSDFYLIEDAKGLHMYEVDFVKALSMAKDKSNYTISYVTYEGKDKWTIAIVFEASQLKSEVRLEQVKVIKQRPELPRGCEVTSLAVLLDYYMENPPDKMTLAREVKKSTTDMRIEEGFVHFSNMHEEFAGSMENLDEEGLGVYIEPIRQLAQEYIDTQAVNISGVSFKQLLTFVSMGKPILIIIPNRYQAVSDYAIEVWKTNSGYMEVTYQEHSVVVLGFDDTYVYYSDPSKGIIDKKPKESFEAAWVSMGSQGLIIEE